MQLPIKRTINRHHRIQRRFLLLLLHLLLPLELPAPLLQTHQVQTLYQMRVLFVSTEQLDFFLCEICKILGKKTLVVLVIPEFLDFLRYSMSIEYFNVPRSRYFDWYSFSSSLSCIRFSMCLCLLSSLISFL